MFFFLLSTVFCSTISTILAATPPPSLVYAHCIPAVPAQVDKQGALLRLMKNLHLSETKFTETETLLVKKYFNDLPDMSWMEHHTTDGLLPSPGSSWLDLWSSYAVPAGELYLGLFERLSRVLLLAQHIQVEEKGRKMISYRTEIVNKLQEANKSMKQALCSVYQLIVAEHTVVPDSMMERLAHLQWHFTPESPIWLQYWGWFRNYEGMVNSRGITAGDRILLQHNSYRLNQPSVIPSTTSSSTTPEN